MYKIKQIPEDFRVTEKPNIEFKENGRYAIIEVEKKGYTTHKIAAMLCDMLRIPQKNVTYAGNKDKFAITKQLFSIKNASKDKIEKIKIPDIDIKLLGYSDLPISLGDLDGNYFELVIRDIDKKPKYKDEVYNFYGEQRFSQNNIEIGKLLIKGDFKKACEIIISQNSDQSDMILNFLEDHKRQYVDAIKRIQFKIVMLYVHSYQSYLWNKTLNECIEKNIDVDEIPIIGFETLKSEKTSDIIKKIMDEEKISQRDFIIREMPTLSAEGGLRKAKIKVHDLEISELEDDELNQGKKKVTIKFFLEKGSYATEAIRQLFNQDNR